MSVIGLAHVDVLQRAVKMSAAFRRNPDTAGEIIIPLDTDIVRNDDFRHRIDRDDQGDVKSGLSELFHAVEIVSEKDPATYRRVMDRHGIDPARFLMVGNSVRSDILPVLATGAHAVHIPYAITWAHEEAEVPDEHYRRLESVRDLPALLADW